MQPPLPLVGEAIKQKGTRAGHGTQSLLSLLWQGWARQRLFSQAAGLEACGAWTVDGHVALEASTANRCSMGPRRGAGKSLTGSSRNFHLF
jgi:hypothetical protein